MVTERISTLEDSPQLRQNLFLESKEDAKADGWTHTKHAKSAKQTYHLQLAEHVFGEVDPVIGVDAERVEDYKADSKRYATSVNGQLGRYLVGDRSPVYTPMTCTV